MLTLKNVAVTGGLSSGKSSVCQILKEFGAYIVSADELVHSLLSLDTPLGAKIVQLLGSGVVRDGALDRKEIARRVFAEPQKLQRLEEILHPEVLSLMKKAYQEACRSSLYRLFVAEVPLLFEAGFEQFFDLVVAVHASPALCRRRFQEQGYSEDEFLQRAERQWPSQEKCHRADITIENSGTLAELKAQVAAIMNTM